MRIGKLKEKKEREEEVYHFHAIIWLGKNTNKGALLSIDIFHKGYCHILFKFKTWSKLGNTIR